MKIVVADLVEGLEELKKRIDEDYAARIEKSDSPRMWDQYEVRSLEMVGKVEDVINYAQSYFAHIVK